MALLELTVRNHPGVLSHVCGLFSRRATNVESVLCLPSPDGTSRIWLSVCDDARVEPLAKQLRKLEDVLDVRTPAPDVFERVERALRSA